MRVTVLFNPVAGTGRAAIWAKEIEQRLQAAGHVVNLVQTRPPTIAAGPKRASDPDGATRHWLDQASAGADLLVIVGGDGAVRLAAGAAARTQTPLYHFPLGTENLFAREFAMDRSLETLQSAIERFQIRTIDLGVCNGRPFLLMASVGFDADVVYHLAACRGSSISHFSYVWPIFAQIRRWRPPTLEVIVDGQRLDDGGPGFVVVANCKQYGWRFNPARNARIDDQYLDIAYFPARSRLDLIRWALKCRLGVHLRDKRLIYRTGQIVSITSSVPLHYQLDGDPPGAEREFDEPPAQFAGDGLAPLSLHIQILPAALRVLVP